MIAGEKAGKQTANAGAQGALNQWCRVFGN